MSSQPPIQFHIENDPKPVNNNSHHHHVPCKLCKVERRRFICKNCLRNGNFIKSNSNNLNESERFVDKQHKLKNLKNSQKQQDEKFNNKFEKIIYLENLRASILKSRSQNTLLQKLIKEKKENIKKLNEIKKENHDKNRAQRIILPKYEDKVNKLGDYVLEAVEKNDHLRARSNEQLDQLKQLRRTNIEKLVKFIFPISQKMTIRGIHSRKASNESLQSEAINELAEAMSTASHDSFDGPKEFIIVAPSLPANGNYQECVDWIQSSKEGTVANAPGVGADPGQVVNNNAYRIAAGLTFIAQVVQALSFYLDIRLPHKVSYNDFCTMGLNERQFRKKVARLNLNVVYLCYTQNIQIRDIQPAQTMKNLVQLLDIRNVDLGKTGPILNTSQRSVDSIMQSFTDILDDEHSDTDEDDSDDTILQKDWENVGNLPMLEITQSAMIPSQASASMAGTIINNVAHSLSFWKWK